MHQRELKITRNYLNQLFLSLVMENYNLFAKHYDAVMGERKKTVGLLKKFISKYKPNAKQILELACGTGTVLKPLSEKYKVYGIDLSSEMLKIAKKKVRLGKFYHQDMTKFNIKGKFDVILCVFDSINHLTNFSDWKKVFHCSRNHLKDNGVFIFDINTEKKLHRLVNEPPWVKQFGKNLLIMKITDEGNGITNWNVKIFEYTGKDKYRLYEENIKEKSFSIKKIKNSLNKLFSSIFLVDHNHKKPSSSSEILYFICKN